MEVKNIALHFPWGAGGNFLRNCLLLDSRFEFDFENRTTEQRYQYLLDFYQQEFDQENWLSLEWGGTRGWLYKKYYRKDNTVDCDTDQPVIFVSHGEDTLVSSLTSNQLIRHILLSPSDPQFIAEMYVSKFPSTDSRQLNGPVFERVHSTLDHIRRFLKTQEQLTLSCNNIKVYDANRLFDNNGYQVIADIAQSLSLQLPTDLVTHLHQLWNNQNKKLHYALFAK